MNRMRKAWENLTMVVVVVVGGDMLIKRKPQLTVSQTSFLNVGVVKAALDVKQRTSKTGVTSSMKTQEIHSQLGGQSPTNPPIPSVCYGAFTSNWDVEPYG